MTRASPLELGKALLLALTAAAAGLGPGCGRTPLLPSGADEPSATRTATDSSTAATSTHPAATDGTCPSGLVACGTGAAARCYDLSRARGHCGQCGNACPPGIACQSGTCRQYRCTGAPTFKTLAAVPTLPANADYTTVPVSTFVPVLGDFDGDGNLDFVGQTGPGTPMGAMLGRGDGTFQTRPLADGFRSTWSAATADLNGDGRLDLATITQNESTVTVRLGSGDPFWLFQSGTTYSAPTVPGSLVLSDLDADGHVDLVTAEAARLTFRRGIGDGRLGDAVDLPVGLAPLAGFVSDPIASQYFLRAADWNRDGVMDLLFGTSTLRMLLGRGDGTFDQEVACGLALDAYNPSDNVLADFDHNQKIDLLVGARLAAGTTLFLDMNGCNFSTSVSPPRPKADARLGPYLGVADLNGDGNADIISAAWDPDPNGSPIYFLYLDDGNGRLAAPIRFPANDTRAAGNILIGDVNNDAKLDVIVTESGGWQVLLSTCS